jgi:hypothetical protein
VPKMNIRGGRTAAAVLTMTLVLGMTALVPAASATASAGWPVRPEPAAGLPAARMHAVRLACPRPVSLNMAACLALVRSDVAGHLGLFAAGSVPAGYGPRDLRSAYALPSGSGGTGETVALVDAFDDPHAAADLSVYRSQYGLAPCTTANGCFEKVNQEGRQGSYPKADSGWAEEESLDIDMVSAACPLCHILLVEASSNSTDDLGKAVDEAVALRARFVSNSYGTVGEPPAETTLDQNYDHPGVVVTASAGDSGYGPEYPAASQYVTSVGGTTLVRNSSVPRGWKESVWGSASGGQGTGSGCSAQEPKPSWQTDRRCPLRTIADVSAVADPATGVAVYDTYQNSGWQEFGGTSVASPLIAAIYALAGTPQVGTYPARYPYDAHIADASLLNDVTSGANGTCTPAYLCTGRPGYDGPTGLGTPNGAGAFKYRQTGQITGTVTDAATGKPVAGAQVSVPRLPTTAGSDGSYRLSVPVGTYQVSVSDYGYQTQRASVTVTANATAPLNVHLALTPRATVAGSVTPGSGVRFPVYARVSWSDSAGHRGQAFTGPATGKYSLSLVVDASYTLTVTPLLAGYLPVTQKVTVGTSGMTRDIAVPVDLTACAAPGYHPVLSGGRLQTFTTTSIPRGWRVTNTNLLYPGYSYRPGWVFNNPGRRANATGGTGNFAIVDSGHYGQSHYQDTKLISPAVSFAADKSPVVEFATDLEPASNSAVSVQVSVDGGKKWATVWRRSGDHGRPGPATVVVPLPKYARQGRVQARFGYTGQASQWWEIDNVFMGNRTCVRQTGGLLVGRVSDTSGAAVNGVTVASVAHPDQKTLTVATPGDNTLNGGLYEVFTTATGSQRFTASMTGFTTATEAITVAAGRVRTLNFTLATAASGTGAR